MKNIITILILFAFGCGKSEPLSPETSTQVLSSYAKLFGSYEMKIEGFLPNTFRYVLLENGKVEFYENGAKKEDGTWKIVRKEVHVSSEGGLYEVAVYKIEPNGDLTFIAYIDNGKRQEATKEFQEFQNTFKKIK